jgi:hypothetical protein
VVVQVVVDKVELTLQMDLEQLLVTVGLAQTDKL